MDATFNEARRKSYGLIGELRRRNPLMFDVAAGHLVLLVLMLIIAPFDSRTVAGINPWIKPMKFAASIAIYLLTIGWLLYELPLALKIKRRLTWVITGTLLIEIVLIVMQAARGVGSHFNQATVLDALVFAVMGLAIMVNIGAAAYVAFKFWRTGAGLPAPYLWGIRMGLTIFILASMEGALMVSHSAHSVGVADGGAGLPFLNWSTKGGDLRVAHFFGIHAIQALPLLGYVLSQGRAARLVKNPLRWMQGAGGAYALISLLLFLWAVSGRPLLAI